MNGLDDGLRAEARGIAEKHGLRGAEAEAFARDYRARLLEERVRVATILCAVGARDRQRFARFIAIETDLDAELAGRTLGAAAIEHDFAGERVRRVLEVAAFEVRCSNQKGGSTT